MTILALIFAVGFAGLGFSFRRPRRKVSLA
jgi:hypothetical protein